MNFSQSYPPNDYRTYLMHHGIKGQKWGVQNGPPYPLGYNDHSAAEKQYFGSSKKSTDKTVVEDMDHSKSDKSPLALYLVTLGLNIATLNVPGLILNTTQGMAAVSAEAKTKKVEKIRAKSQVDKKTGLHLKSEDMTEKEDLKMINPSFLNFDGNTKNNCMLCTVAYDMRRRGYEVSANKASTGYQINDATRWYKNSKVEHIKEFNSKDKFSERLSTGMKAAFSLNRGLTNAVKNELIKQGDGARGNLMLTWDYSGSGHSVAYEIVGGKLILRDGQTGRSISNPGSYINNSIAASYVRYDNVNPDFKRIKEAVR